MLTVVMVILDNILDLQERDLKFMQLALSEAKKGLGRTAPNPCVGAVITDSSGVEISRGYHRKAGTAHAEINALEKAGNRAGGATMYVTLEPCNHTGRTPPCSHAVAESGIARVVVGMTDPNPLVSGSGCEYLRSKNIDVVTGILENDCRELNLPFIKHILTGIPFVIMKAGISLDGKLNYQKNIPGKMTGAASLEKLHSIRDSVDAILVGSGTLLADNPSLTTRVPSGGHNPVRVILDSKLQISADSKVLNPDAGGGRAIVFCGPDADDKRIAELSPIDNLMVKVVETDQHGMLDLDSILNILGKEGICSLLIEGGAKVHTGFLRQGLVDRVMLFMAPLFAGSAGNSLLEDYQVAGRESAPMLQNVSYTACGEDIMIQGDLFRQKYSWSEQT